MKVGDLVKIDYKGWKLSVEFLESLRERFCGVIIDKFTRQHDKAKYITIITTDGKYKTFPCSPKIPPNISVVSAGNH